MAGATPEGGLSALLGGQTATEDTAIGGDDLTKIEGVGPAIAKHLNEAGINSFSELAATTPERIREILDAQGGYGAHDPTTWPDQSQLAASGEWGHLKEWQDQLDGGRIVGGEAPALATPPAEAAPTIPTMDAPPVETTFDAPPATADPVVSNAGFSGTPTPESVPATPATPVGDDLTKIEGIGPAIAGHLNAAGITTFAQLAGTDPAQVKQILDNVGGYGAHNTSTWSDQAQLAASGEWEQLKEWQDQLDGGKPSADAPAPIAATPAPIPEDLTKIEGIGPKIAEHLNAGGITTFAQIAETTAEELQGFLAAGGFGAHQPTTWPEQARMAAAGEWDKLSQWQDELDGGKIVASDDLTKVEGIGPKVAELLNAAGIMSFAQLASTSPESIKAILEAEGGLMASRNPTTWPDQAQLAATGEWDKLKEWQDELDGGV
ncbi:MAG: DUF4332 domain-containing protein [Mariniblastus sp.]